jgi:hypothetical protein
MVCQLLCKLSKEKANISTLYPGKDVECILQGIISVYQFSGESLSVSRIQIFCINYLGKRRGQRGEG